MQVLSNAKNYKNAHWCYDFNSLFFRHVLHGIPNTRRLHGFTYYEYCKSRMLYYPYVPAFFRYKFTRSRLRHPNDSANLGPKNLKMKMVYNYSLNRGEDYHSEGKSFYAVEYMESKKQ
jgi:hypothetical protein